MKILFADDEKNLREVLADELRDLGHRVTACVDGKEAKTALDKDSFDLLLVDLDMPGAGGLEVIASARGHGSDADAVILTGKATKETAIEAIHLGVFEYITKPYKIIDLELLLNRIAEKRQLMKRCEAMNTQIRRIEGDRRLIGESKPMQEVQRLIDRIAPTESTVVVLGDTGTGKELVARAIHDRSRRRDKPFVAVNCGALPETLIESELFGHRKGSFTGADANRTGLFEVANGGTLFLDEIGELPKGVQAKLLRFLESGEVRKIGENSSTHCDVRVVCATLRDLESMVRSGEFREDLWFRINTFEIHLPPLRERRDDIPDLVSHLAKRFRNGINCSDIRQLFTREVCATLENYDWPGNVRQLANTIEHALILAEGEPPYGPECLPQTFRTKRSIYEPAPQVSASGRYKEVKPTRPVVTPDASGSSAEDEQTIEPSTFDPSMPTALRDIEMKAIEVAMQRHGGNKAKAAEELGISLKTLYNKLNQSEGKRTA